MMVTKGFIPINSLYKSYTKSSFNYKAMALIFENKNNCGKCAIIMKGDTSKI